MKRINNIGRYGRNVTRILLYKAFKSGMMEIIGVLKVEESLVISFVVKILKRGVLKVDDSQGNE